MFACRMVCNRNSARKCRHRREAHVQELQARLLQLQAQNASLNDSAQKLEEHLSAMQEEVLFHQTKRQALVTQVSCCT